MKIDRTIDWLARVITVLMACGLLVTVCLNFANVVGRYGFSRAIIGAEELQSFTMVWIVFLGTAVVTTRDQHLRMDMITNALPESGRRALKVLEQIVVLVIGGFVTVQSSKYVLQVFSINQTSDAIEIPMVIPHSAVTVGFALIVMITLLRLVSVALGKNPGRNGSGA